MTERHYLSVKDLMRRYSIHRATVWRWSQNPDFPAAVRLGRNTTRWPLDEIEAWEDQFHE